MKIKIIKINRNPESEVSERPTKTIDPSRPCTHWTLLMFDPEQAKVIAIEASGRTAQDAAYVATDKRPVLCKRSHLIGVYPGRLSNYADGVEWPNKFSRKLTLVEVPDEDD